MAELALKFGRMLPKLSNAIPRMTVMMATATRISIREKPGCNRFGYCLMRELHQICWVERNLAFLKQHVRTQRVIVTKIFRLNGLGGGRSVAGTRVL